MSAPLTEGPTEVKRTPRGYANALSFSTKVHLFVEGREDQILLKRFLHCLDKGLENLVVIDTAEHIKQE